MFIYRNGQQENIVLDNFEKLNLLIEEWKNSILNERIDLCVAISRKAPRLLEWSLGKQCGDGIPVITELALPFLDMVDYHQCIVLDEAIYHGTTFEKVLSLLEPANSHWKRLEAKPLVVTTEALSSDVIKSHLSSYNNIIEQNELPFFVDSVISKFLELGKPYDVEYPIVYIDLKHDITEEMLDSIMVNLSEIESDACHINKDDIHYYKVENYSHECNKIFFSYTYRTDYRFAHEEYGRMIPDFSKLRFYVRGNRLCIASIAPYTIPEQFIARNHRMFTGEFEDIWEMLYAKVGYGNNEEYEYQKTKSLVMATNYLLSYGHFLSLKGSLLEALDGYAEKVEFYQDKNDLIYLFGEVLANALLVKLENVQSFTLNGAALNLGKSKDAFIPDAYWINYNQQIALDNLRKGQTENASLMVSSIFSAMHWQVEIPSRKANYEDYSRLRFGESYASIKERLERVSNESNLLNAIHENIDQRIDRGSIVPNYVRVEFGIFSSWKRLFRSGENEDVAKDQLLRIVLSIIMDYFNMVGRNYVMRDVLEFILSIVYFAEQDLEKKILPEKLFGLPLRPSFNLERYMYEMNVMVDAEEVSILQYAEDNGILIEDRFKFISIANSAYVENLSKGCSLDNDMRVALNKIFSFVSYIDTEDRSYSEVLLDLLNGMYYEDSYVSFIDLKVKAKNVLREFILSSIFDEEQILECDSWCLMTFFRKVRPIDKILSRDINESFKGELYCYLLSKWHKDEDRETYIYLLSVLNLWYYYHSRKVDQFFDQEIYDIFLSLVDGNNWRFSDGTECYKWLHFDGSYENVVNVGEDDLRSRLCELLNFKF